MAINVTELLDESHIIKDLFIIFGNDEHQLLQQTP